MLAYTNIRTLITNSGVVKKDGRRIQESDLGICANGALVVDKGKILFSGSMEDFKKSPFSKAPTQDCSSWLISPGFIDCHTHLWYGGDRAEDFKMRLAGFTYEQISQNGGGIKRTVKATRTSREEELCAEFRKRLILHASQGITTTECKYSYSLNTADRLTLERTWNIHQDFISIVPTWMSVHDLAPEFSSHDTMIEWALEEISHLDRSIPGLSVDIFVDRGYFTLDHAQRIWEKCQRQKTPMRIHGDELANLEVASWATEHQCLSVDHLLHVSEKGIDSLASSNTTAVLLPGTALTIKAPMAPGRKLVDRGARIAIATDHNPGSCPLINIRLIASLGAIHMGLSIPEIFAGITWNAGTALGLSSKIGALIPGFDADFVAFDVENVSELFYRPEFHAPVFIHRAIFSS